MENPKGENLANPDEKAKPAENEAKPRMVEPEVVDRAVHPPKHEEQTTSEGDSAPRE